VEDRAGRRARDRRVLSPGIPPGAALGGMR
jgi:hypothetical protein